MIYYPSKCPFYKLQRQPSINCSFAFFRAYLKGNLSAVLKLSEWTTTFATAIASQNPNVDKGRL